MIKILALSHFDPATQYYRIAKPFGRLDPGRFEVTFRPAAAGFPNAETCALYDIVFACRLRNPEIMPHALAMASVSRLVVDYDDLFSDPGDGRDVMNWLAPRVSGITGIVPELTAYFAGLAPTLAYHNAIELDDPHYKMAPLPKIRNKVVLFLGTTGADPETVEYTRPILLPLFEKYPNLMVKYVGHYLNLRRYELPASRAIFQGELPIEQYLRSMSHADLCMTLFRWGRWPWGKGIPRLLQCGAWGVPSVYSPIPAALRFLHESSGGVAVVRDNRPESWVATISELIDDTDRRVEMGEKARQTVRENYSQQAQSRLLGAFLEQIAAQPLRGY